jgi:hypothetical protein
LGHLGSYNNGYPSGVYGYSGSYYGVYGYGGASSGGGYFCNSSGYYARLAYSSYALYGSGSSYVSGSKSALVQTEDHGWRAVYSMESPEIWFEDFGEGRLVDGRCRVELDPVFLQTVTIDGQNPMRVYANASSGEAIGLGIVKGTTGFEAVGPEGSNATFDWRVVAKRSGYEDVRLADMTSVVEESPVTPNPR